MSESSLHLDAVEAGTAGSPHVHNQLQPKDKEKYPLKNGSVLRIRRSPPGQNRTDESLRGTGGRQTAVARRRPHMKGRTGRLSTVRRL